MTMTTIKNGNKVLFRQARSAVNEQKPFVKMMNFFREEMAREWSDEEKVLYVSKGNDKADVVSYSTMPGFTCMRNGQYPPCFTSGAGYCLRDIIYPEVMKKAVHNTVLILKYPAEYRESYKAFNAMGMPRLHVEGDFVNETELDVVNTESKTIVMTYTKQYDLCNKYFDTHKLNPNFKLLYSAWDGLEMKNPHGFKKCAICATAEEFLKVVGPKCGCLKKRPDGSYTLNKGKCSQCLIRHYMNGGLKDGGCFDDGEVIYMLAH